MERGGTGIAEWCVMEISGSERSPQAFANRREAGIKLAEHLKMYAWREDVVVLGLPRGGVPVAYEVARRLRAPLDVFVFPRLGVPGEQAECARLERVYRNWRPLVSIEGRVAILVDDGLATGSTMHAAVLAVRRLHAAAVIVAVPVGSRQACDAVSEVADRVICALTPVPFSAVGVFYLDFAQTTDGEVRHLLAKETAVRAMRRSA